jgi:hypothetical protein|tara:strand:- start:87 stop:260 length:174 start_codon:yes stop_codon:yes gene_type:complete
MTKLIFGIFGLLIVLQALTGWDFLSLFLVEVSTPIGFLAFIGLILLYGYEVETETKE